MANEDTINLNLNSTKTAARPSHEAVEAHTGNATDEEKKDEKLDRIADESAQRSTNRIHAEEQKNPEDTLFTK